MLVNKIKKSFIKKKPLVSFLKKKLTKKNVLQYNPFRRGIVKKVFVCSPKKPNSAKRKVVKVKLSSGKYITCALRGKGHSLQEHSSVLIRGGRLQDVPGVHYTLVRGKYDLKGVKNKTVSRSRYGVKLMDVSSSIKFKR